MVKATSGEKLIFHYFWDQQNTEENEKTINHLINNDSHDHFSKITKH